VTGVPTDAFDVRVSVPRVRLDDFFAREPMPPDLLKIDVDGAEMDVLAGMPKILAQDGVELLLEIHRHLLPAFGSTAEAVVERLRGLGFRLSRVAGFRDRAPARFVELESAAEIQSPSGDMCFVSRTPPAPSTR
jgi:hypothetical protein